MPYDYQPEVATQGDNTPTGSQINYPANYPPKMIPLNAHGRPDSQVHQQQGYPPHQCAREQYPQQQQSHHQRSQHLQTQARPMHQVNAMAAPQVPSKTHKPAKGSAVTALLPYCTADVPLNEGQVINVTDVVGSLKELVLLALGAKAGDEDCMHRLGSALDSEQTVAGIVDFFSGEFEVE